MSAPKFRIAGPGAVIAPGSPNQFAWFDSTNTLGGLPQWFVNPVTDGAAVDILIPVDNTGFHQLHDFNMRLDPYDRLSNGHQRNISIATNIDPNSTGFAIGTGGQAVQNLQLEIDHNGTSNTGNLSWLQMEGARSATGRIRSRSTAFLTSRCSRTSMRTSRSMAGSQVSISTLRSMPPLS